MSERRGLSTPVVAASAVVAMAAADIVRRRRAERSGRAYEPAQVPLPGPVTASPRPASVPRHRAPETTPEPNLESALPDHEPPALETDPTALPVEASATPPIPPLADEDAPAQVTPEPAPAEDGATVEPLDDTTQSVGDDSEDLTPSDPDDGAVGAVPTPNWWHRDHPTFSALTGFFTGILFLIVVPGAYAGVLAQLVDYNRAEELFPFVLLTLIVPIVLAAVPRTRRFGLFMLLGLISTLVVVAVVGGAVLYLLFAVS